MTVRDTLVAALRAWVDRYDGEIAPNVPEQIADAYRAEVRRDVLTEAADAADQIARTHLSFGAIGMGRGARGAERRLRRMAAEPEQPKRARVLTQSWPGQPPHLTIRLEFDAEYTDAGIEEITARVRAAAQHGYRQITEAPLGCRRCSDTAGPFDPETGLCEGCLAMRGEQ